MMTLPFLVIMKRVVIGISCALLVLNTKISLNPIMPIPNRLLTKNIRRLPKPLAHETHRWGYFL